MAHHRQLPVWNAAMDLAVYLEHAVRRFPRYHKYTLGSELRHTAQRLCQQVARANTLRGQARAAALDELVLGAEEMKSLLTLAQETRAFAHFNEFATATELTVGLGKQSGGWRRLGRAAPLGAAAVARCAGAAASGQRLVARRPLPCGFAQRPSGGPPRSGPLHRMAAGPVAPLAPALESVGRAPRRGGPGGPLQNRFQAPGAGGA